MYQKHQNRALSLSKDSPVPSTLNLEPEVSLNPNPSTLIL